MKKVLEFLFTMIFMLVMGYLVKMLYTAKLSSFLPSYSIAIFTVVLGIIFYHIFAHLISSFIILSMDRFTTRITKMSLKDIVTSCIGLLIGLIIANLIGLSVTGYGILGTFIVFLLNIVFGVLGYRIAAIKKDEIGFDTIFENRKGNGKNISYGKPKILDTSVIIDGRILDLLKTGFIEGKIIIPNFVLEELRHIADSADSLKRNRGRRGLDILNEIQKQQLVNVEIIEYEFKEQLEVDVKLLKMAEKIDAFVVTNDFNLNKVAEFQGVKVLNINELSNAIKPVVLPGEDMTVTIIKSGKELGQGIAYLNDGTMIVIDGGNKYIGETINVTVTSVLQTAAGRMIFGKKKD